MKSLRMLIQNPMFWRELDVRAARDDGYRLFNYAGPGLYLLILQTPVLYGLLGSALGWTASSEAWTTPLFLVTLWMQVLYFSHAAARFCAGSFAIERERGTMDALRLIPRPSRELLFGKYLAAIAPLLVEAVLSAPFMAIYAFYGAVAFHTVFFVTVMNVALILFFGMCGIFWSLHSRDVLSAVSRGFCMALVFNLFPLVGGVLLKVFDETMSAPSLMLSPLSVASSLVHPSVSFLHAIGHDVLLLGVQLLAFGLIATLLYRSALRRLNAR